MQFFRIFFEVSGKSHSVEKFKRGPFEIFEHPFCCKTEQKLKRDPLEH